MESATSRLQAAKESSKGESGKVSPNGTLTPQAPVTIKAPVNGIVTGLTVASGSTVQAGQQVMALGSGQTVEIVVQLEQNDLHLVCLGTSVGVEVAGHSIMGQISSIFPQVQDNKISSFTAHIKLINPPSGLLKAGMAVNVHIDNGQ